MSRFLIIVGLVFIVLGLLWPLVMKLNLWHLPGDLVIKRKGLTIYFPITSSIIISLVITLILWFLQK